jgi:acyl phosphate:glycerol-3-phosphate acyltransferase
MPASPIVFAIVFLLAYLLGSIPTALWVGKLFYHLDIRQHGSGNSGATNTFRVLGKKAGTGVLTFDILKGFLAAFLAYGLLRQGLISPSEVVRMQLALGLTAVLGHIYSVFAGFKGGKGVASLLGVVLGVAPLPAALCVVVFLVLLWFTSYVSVSSMTSAAAFPALVGLFGPRDPWLIGFGLLVTALVLYTHRQNIGRLRAGTESKVNPFGR